MRARGIDAAAGEKQIADERVAQVAFETGDAAEAGDQAEAQLGEREAGHFVGDDDVAGEGQLETAAEADAVDGGDSSERRDVDGVEHSVDALEELTHASQALFSRERFGGTIKFTKVGAGGKALFASTRNNAGSSVCCQSRNCCRECFEVGQSLASDFVGGLVIQRQLDNTVAPVPTKRFADEMPHDCFLSYMELISDAKRALIASRRSLPLAVSRPFSGVKDSRTTAKLRTWR